MTGVQTCALPIYRRFLGLEATPTPTCGGRGEKAIVLHERNSNRGVRQTVGVVRDGQKRQDRGKKTGSLIQINTDMHSQIDFCAQHRYTNQETKTTKTTTANELNHHCRVRDVHVSSTLNHTALNCTALHVPWDVRPDLNRGVQAEYSLKRI